MFDSFWSFWTNKTVLPLRDFSKFNGMLEFNPQGSMFRDTTTERTHGITKKNDCFGGCFELSLSVWFT